MSSFSYVDRYRVALVLVSVTVVSSGAAQCDTTAANECVGQLETSLQNWTQAEECIEFAKSDGDFSRCKKILEACTNEITLLQSLSSLNVRMNAACQEVCQSFKDIQKRCSIDFKIVVEKNYTAFCSKYTDAIKCAKNYSESCVIATEFHQKAVISSQFSRMYRNLCNKGCSSLDSTIEVMEECSAFGNSENCSFAEFDSCIRQLNTSLCPEYKKLYSHWFHPKCESVIYLDDKQTAITTDLSSSSTLTSSELSLPPEYTVLHSTNETKAQKEGHDSSNSFSVSVTVVSSAAAECDTTAANACIRQLENSLQNWTQTEKCIEFAKSDGDFSRCKKILEACTYERTLLQRLSSLNVTMDAACQEVCQSFKDIKQHCNGDFMKVLVKNYTAFCSKYTDAIKCAIDYSETCVIATKFHQKAVISSPFSRMYRNLCNKGCSSLDSTIQAINECSAFGNSENCSFAEFNSCIRQLNISLCPEYKKLYSRWSHPKCELVIDLDDRQTGITNDLSSSSTLTSSELSLPPGYTVLYSMNETKTQKEGHVSSNSFSDLQINEWNVFLVAFMSELLLSAV